MTIYCHPIIHGAQRTKLTTVTKPSVTDGDLGQGTFDSGTGLMSYSCEDFTQKFRMSPELYHKRYGNVVVKPTERLAGNAVPVHEQCRYLVPKLAHVNNPHEHDNGFDLGDFNDPDRETRFAEQEFHHTRPESKGESELQDYQMGLSGISNTPTDMPTSNHPT